MLNVVIGGLSRGSTDPLHNVTLSVSGGKNRDPLKVTGACDSPRAGVEIARLVKEISFKPARDSICCGSARILPGGDWVVAWGHTPWVTEQSASGRPVFTLQFTNPLFMSYRAVPVLPGRRLERSTLRRGMDAMLAP